MSMQTPVPLLPITNCFHQEPRESPNTLTVSLQAGVRDRSQSASDFERLSLADPGNYDNGQRENGSLSPPLIASVKETRSLSLTPEPTTRPLPSYATLGRQKFKRGKTIDTPSIRKEEHEVCIYYIISSLLVAS